MTSWGDSFRIVSYSRWMRSGETGIVSGRKGVQCSTLPSSLLEHSAASYPALCGPREEKFDSQQYWGSCLWFVPEHKYLSYQHWIYFTSIFFPLNNALKTSWPNWAYSKDCKPGLIFKNQSMQFTQTDSKGKEKYDPLNICRKNMGQKSRLIHDKNF